MSERKKGLASRGPGTTNSFDPLSIFQEQSSAYQRLPSHTPLVQDHLDKAAQATKGFTFHDIFVSKNTFVDWIFAILVYRPTDRDKAITKRTSFSVDLIVDHQKRRSSPFLGHFTDVPLVDVIESECDGKRVIIGMLCIAVHIRMDEFQYTLHPQGRWFEDLNSNTKAGVRVDQMAEVRDEDMPFNYVDVDLDKNYVFALDYNIKKTAEKNRLIQVKTLDPRSVDRNLALFPETFLRQDESGVYLLIWVAHKNNQKLPITTQTPFTIELVIRKGPEAEKPLKKNYNKEISVKPIAVDVVEGFNYGLLIVSVPRENEWEVQFFQEAFTTYARSM